jgi:hypothetical protein
MPDEILLAAAAAGATMPGPVLEIHDGALDADGCFTGRAFVTGDGVLDYRAQFGVMIYRPAAEVFDAASTNTLKLIPVTLGHPPKNLTAETIRQYAIGWTGEQVERVGNRLAVNFRITDAKAAQACAAAKAAGRRIQFSIGGKAKAKRQAGTHQGQSYEAMFHDISYNHLALLLDARGRYPYTELIDSADADPDEVLFVMDGLTADPETPQPQEKPLVKFKLLNGREIEVADAEVQYLENDQADHKEAKARLATAEGQVSTLTRQLEQTEAQVMDADEVKKQKQDWAALAAEALPLLKGKSIADLAVMDEADIQEAVLIAGGASAAELQQEKTARGELYPTFLAGAYSLAKKAAGRSASQQIMDAAGAASGVARGLTPAAQGGQAEGRNPFNAAKSKLEQRMEQRRKGEIV